jgi:lariat debranching enzyme
MIHSLAVPPKYRDLGTFHQYYSQQWTVPVLTIFIGGNHEASQPLSELYYGGWVAPNMYYLGAAGVVRYRGIRIGGISGIYKSHDHVHSRFEVPPYDNSTLRSIYHYRNVEVYRLLCLAAGNRDAPTSDPAPSPRLGVMLSHDWPQGIEQYGDTDGLIRRKPFFRQEIADNSLGTILWAALPWHSYSTHCSRGTGFLLTCTSSFEPPCGMMYPLSMALLSRAMSQTSRNLRRPA